ncbi:hypothetical protein BDB01DRAFT_779233 [Pilobolus umbonatus]|nr:hypothetical protein BDB01DRAFT_779233 [Pilobolus umbonatus]
MSTTNIPPTIVQKLAIINEQAWLTLGNLAEMMADWERAINSYEAALRHNPYSINALSHIASLWKGREQFPKAIDYYKRILSVQDNNGEIWSALGHCYLMMDNLQDAYQAYQQALYHLPNPKDPNLWYGIGILYDRYGSIDHAEEAFSAVMKMDPNFEKSNEIYFRLGIIYKQQQKFDLSLQCFRYILQNPPRPLTETDIWFQTGHVHEQQKEYESAKEAYERVLSENPDHAKVLQQLGWLYHQQNTSFSNQSMAIQYLTRSLKADGTDAQSWYLLGRCFMVDQNYTKAYEAYQQAVYRDARNPTFWCSIGVLYYQINQYRDALDAYSRAIRLNPYISEVWYDLGTLYESCNNQIQDALDAYQRASELDSSNPHIRQRLELLRKSSSSSVPMTTTPVPQDVNNPYQYQNGPTNNTSQYPPPPPLVSGPQQGTSNGMPPYPPSSSLPRSNYDHTRMHPQDAPRDLPLPPPPSSERRSPVPYGQNSNISNNNKNNNSTHHTEVRIPDIGGGGGRAPVPSEHAVMQPMREPRSPIYNHHRLTKMPSVIRSPIPSHQGNKSPPRLSQQPPPSQNPPPLQHHYYSPRQPPPPEPSFPTYPYDSNPNEPLRRTSVLYESDKPPTLVKREPFDGPRGGQLPAVVAHQQHHRHNSTSSNHSQHRPVSIPRPSSYSPTKKSPVENSAADTLMSIAQKGYVNHKGKRPLELADTEEEDDKRARIDDSPLKVKRMMEFNTDKNDTKRTTTPPKDGSIPVSS